MITKKELSSLSSIPVCDLEFRKNSRQNKLLRRKEQKSDESEEDENEDYEEKVRVVKKRTVKILDVNSEDEQSKSEDSDSIYNEEDNVLEDPDFDVEEEKKKEKKSRSDNNVLYKVPKRELSAYEVMVQKNREEKLAILQALKIEEAKFGLSTVVKSARKKTVKPVKRKFVKTETPSVVRKSRRLANLSVDFSEDALSSNAWKVAQDQAVELKKGAASTLNTGASYPSYNTAQGRWKRRRRTRRKKYKKFIMSCIKKQTIPAEMTFKEALESEDLYESYVAHVNFQEIKSEAKWVMYDKSVLQKMTVSESNIAKVTPARITALAWYPSSEHLILAAGDKYGNLGIWNVDSESNPYVMRTHLEGTTNLQFNPFNQVQLVSSSYDGILRCGDMVQQKFYELYNISDETSCTYFDILSATTYLVAQKDGLVALVDRRAKGESCQKKHTCHDFSIKTVNIHPVNRNFFVTAENRGCIRLWDLRKLQKDPVADIDNHKRCVHSAYFSPVTGNSILATSTDDSVSIFDSTNLTSDIKLKKQMKHDNQTGRWLSVFRATWLPNSEEAFVIGSMHYPRKVEVFDKNMFAYSIMQHENLTTITSTNAFHPMRSALAGANSSGKVFVFI